MNWVIEVIMVLAILMFGHSFWSIMRAKAHFFDFMNNPTEMTSYLDFCGKSSFLEEASTIEPVFGSWKSNIQALTLAHFKGMDKKRNLCLVGILVTLVVSWFALPRPFFISNLVLSFLLAYLPVHSSLQNQNYAHAHTVLMNLYRWGRDSGGFQREPCPDFISTAWETLRLWALDQF